MTVHINAPSQVVAHNPNTKSISKAKAKLMSRARHSAHGSPNQQIHARLDRLLATQFVQLVLRRRALQAAAQNSGSSSTENVYKPRMDLYDDPSNPLITAILELPGMQQEDVAIHIEGSQLLIEGERHAPSFSYPHTAPSDHHSTHLTTPLSVRPAHLHPSAAATASTPVRELKYGRFRRAITVPAGLRPSDIQAALREGMLLLSWPRALSRAGGAGAREDGADGTHGGGA